MAEFKPDSVAPAVCTKETFLKAWMQFMYPYHRLTPREQDLAVIYLETYLKLCKDIPDNVELRNKILMSEETQRDIREKCGLKVPQIQLYKSKFRQNKFLINGRINPKMIPSIDALEKDKYQLLVVFDMKGK